MANDLYRYCRSAVRRPEKSCSDPAQSCAVAELLTGRDEYRSKVHLNGPRGAILRADLWDAAEQNRTSHAALLHARDTGRRRSTMLQACGVMHRAWNPHPSRSGRRSTANRSFDTTHSRALLDTMIPRGDTRPKRRPSASPQAGCRAVPSDRFVTRCGGSLRQGRVAAHPDCEMDRTRRARPPPCPPT